MLEPVLEFIENVDDKYEQFVEVIMKLSDKYEQIAGIITEHTQMTTKLSEEMNNSVTKHNFNQTVDFLFQLNDKFVDFDRVCIILVKPTAKTVANLGTTFSTLDARISQCEEALLHDDDD